LIENDGLIWPHLVGVSRRGWFQWSLLGGETEARPDATGLTYLNNRYHDPQLAAFTSIDPLVGKAGTPYLYANGNPVTLSDPSGLEPGCGSTETPSTSCSAAHSAVNAALTPGYLDEERSDWAKEQQDRLNECLDFVWGCADRLGENSFEWDYVKHLVLLGYIDPRILDANWRAGIWSDPDAYATSTWLLPYGGNEIDVEVLGGPDDFTVTYYTWNTGWRELSLMGLAYASGFTAIASLVAYATCPSKGIGCAIGAALGTASSAPTLAATAITCEYSFDDACRQSIMSWAAGVVVPVLGRSVDAGGFAEWGGGVVTNLFSLGVTAAYYDDGSPKSVPHSLGTIDYPTGDGGKLGVARTTRFIVDL